MVDAIHLERDGHRDVVVEHAEVAVADPPRAIGQGAAGHVVEDDHLVAHRKEASDEVRADEARAAGDGDAVASPRAEVHDRRERRKVAHRHRCEVLVDHPGDVCLNGVEVCVPTWRCDMISLP